MSPFRRAAGLSLALVLVAVAPPAAATHLEPITAPSPAPEPRPTEDTAPPPPAPEGMRTFAAPRPSATELAGAMDISDDILVSASIGDSDPRAFAISDGVPFIPDGWDEPGGPDDPIVVLGAGASSFATMADDDDALPFPSRGETFLVMSTGDASHAMAPNSTGYLTTFLDGLKNAEGQDMAQLELVLQAPPEARCLAFDVAFYSEEYPEYVGSAFNDAFTAQLYSGETWILDGAVEAPGNFAQDSQGRPLTVNTTFDMTETTTTTYDGGTPRLRAATPVLGGREVALYLTIQDLGDSAFDSAAFIDNLFFSTDALCRFGSAQDSDGDGLLDEWETHGLTMVIGGEQYFVDLPAMGAHPQRKDVFVEIDYMEDASHSHRPDPDAIADVVDAFASNGIRLHVDYGPDAPLTYGEADTWGSLSQANSIPHSEFFGSTGFFSNSYSWRAFDRVKTDNFDLGRAAVFHYNLWIHHMEEGSRSSGRSRGVEGGASDFIVSLADWGDRDGAQAGTFMHELGHNLGLGHGGSDHVNRKPNYISVMNYDHQFGLPHGYPGPRFDYSFVKLASLDENDLDEHVGIGITADLGLRARFHCTDTETRRLSDSQPIDWNCDGTIESGVSGSINRDSARGVLDGHNDWRNLVFTGGSIGAPGGIIELPEETIDVEPEPDYETYLEVVGGAPVVDAAPVVTGGPFRVGDDVAVSLPFEVTSGDGGNMTAEWTWGDGATSAGVIEAGVSPVAAGSHTYAQPGTYSVTVTITGPDGAATSSAATVSVEAEASGGSASAIGWLTMNAPGQRTSRVYVAMDARTVQFGSGMVGASLVLRPDAGLTVAGASVERITVAGRTAVVDSRVLVNGRPGYLQRVTLVDGRPGQVRIQVWDPAKGGPDDLAARVLDTTSGGGPAAAPTVLISVRG